MEDSDMRRLLLTLRSVIEDDTPSLDDPARPGIPSLPESEVGVTNKLYYTSTNNVVITPYSTSAFGVNITSNSYNSTLGMNVIEFDGEVTTVGSNAFRNRQDLLNVILPDSVTSIGDRAFYYCNSLNSINTGKNIESIGASAFSTCSLVNIAFGEVLKSVGQYAFYGIETLEKVYIEASTPPTGGYAMFESVSENCKIYVPSSSVSAYSSASRWSTYSAMIVGYEFQ